MTQAQKIAKEKFKKAIAYRKKTGATLKEAFAFVYGRKVSPVKKKAAPKKKAATKKKAAPKKKAALKKVAAIKIIEKGESKNTKAKATYQQIRTKKGTYKGFKKVAGIKVISGDTIGKWGQAEKYSYKLAIELEGKFKNFLILFKDRLKMAKSDAEKKFYRGKIEDAKKMVKEFQYQQKALLSIK